MGRPMKRIVWLAGALALVAIGAGVFIWSGVYDVAADDPHWAVTQSLLKIALDRSVESRTSGITVPNLGSDSLIRAGAGNYDAMCAQCHLEPGEDDSELSKGLYPAPPDLSRRGIDNSAEAFWIIKHGIKMTGMAAWGKSMGDDDIWGMVAFLQRLPKMSENEYHELVEASGGHSHSGHESGHDEHEHEHKD